jgi:dephospho-CoA kinase
LKKFLDTIGLYRWCVRIGLAGGIGSGKSTAEFFLREWGFDVVDADVVARDIVAPGQPTLQALIDAFGRSVLDINGELDREFLGRLVFRDPTALRRLNAITHPAIGIEILRRLSESSDRAVFVALPLFRPEHRTAFGLDEVWLIDVSPETALVRLVEGRGLSEEDARHRIAAQISQEARRQLVDVIISNEGSTDDLADQIRGSLIQRSLLDG